MIADEGRARIRIVCTHASSSLGCHLNTETQLFFLGLRDVQQKIFKSAAMNSQLTITTTDEPT